MKIKDNLPQVLLKLAAEHAVKVAVTGTVVFVGHQIIKEVRRRS